MAATKGTGDTIGGVFLDHSNGLRVKHYEENIKVRATPEALFAFADDFRHLSSHMSRPSWMMAGGRMELLLDEGEGRRVGSIVRMRGRVLGIDIRLEEFVIEREMPHRKAWKTIGLPRLLVIGPYQMRFDVTPQDDGARLRVAIDYELPSRNRWMGWLFGPTYARWCVQQMIGSTKRQFGG